MFIACVIAMTALLDFVSKLLMYFAFIAADGVVAWIQVGDPGEQAQMGSRSGVRGGVPPCILSAYYLRGMDPDARIV